jgi:hypothetical protein
MWGGDLPLLLQIVTNTLNTLMELQKQSNYMSDELAGIKDRIDRVKTIAEVVQPSTWSKWKDPTEALRRLKVIYHTMPKEYRSEKADAIEDELSAAMNLVARVSSGTATTFASGKELESRGANASPGVAQKLTASGVGTLIAAESQSLVMQSHITSLLAQMLADANDRETRTVVSHGANFSAFSSSLNQNDSRFSTHAMSFKAAL